ncbi:penicillin-binding protein 1F [Marinithermofilum abyssi]|uniref:Penicillin-binding protein 1F n=1 Tax=Marinithermofilum abyssi TaxID=1571185 RepID=A0A8J2VHP6_9BACL|nr:transglycosylase domain-containing protein [Marinithermofilum abyssi]GGE09599.1 penicillin-binding protein 1F [Marinithermofilum abyssi]
MDELRRGNGSFPSRARAHGRSSRTIVRKKGNGGKGNWKRFFNWKWILLVFVTAILLAVGGCSAVLMSAPTYSLDQIQKMDYSTQVYDHKNQPAIKLGAVNREPITMKEMQKKNPLLPLTFVKVEDERFYQHNGIDYKGFGRAIVRNIVAMGKAEGASTITMQVARNAVLQQREKTMSRKLNEIAVALNLEEKYSKADILQSYLNYIYLGNDVAGVKMAAKVYFNKDITKDKLEPQEIALLAGLPKAPEGYNPFTNPEKAKFRRNVVLDKMAQTDSTIRPLITKEEAEKYKKMPLGVDKENLNKYVKQNGSAAYKEMIKREAEKRFGIDDKTLAGGGYKIYTGLNTKAQEAVDKAIKDKRFYKGHENLDAGLTMVDPNTGEIAAVGGGRKYLPGYALRATENHQPGSTIKPLTVFAPAVERGDYNEYYTVPDKKITIGQWTPKNYDNEYHGDIPMQEVVAKSLNASTIWLLKNVVTLDYAYKKGVQAGLELGPKDKGSYAALGLGGLTRGVDTVQMAQAYTAFPNAGEVAPAHVIRKIVKPDGEILEPKDGMDYNQKKRVYTKKAAWYTHRMLRNVVEDGTGIYAKLNDGRPLAGKTGTTQNSKEAWFVGYTPDYVTAVTVFNQGGEEVELTGGGYPAQIFKQVMEETLAGIPPKDFQNPGVPEPQPPFELKPVGDLQASFDQAGKQVTLQWGDYSDRLKYRVERSEDQSNWQPIGETTEGTFSDKGIQMPDAGGGFFGGDQPAEPKTYYYRIVAIDTQAKGGEKKEADPGNVAQVAIQPQQPQPGQDQGDKPDDKKGNTDQGEQQDPGGFLGGGDQQQGGEQDSGDQQQQGGDQTPPPPDGQQQDDGGFF